MQAYHENRTNPADCTSYEIPASMPNLAALLDFASGVECGPVLEGGYEGYERSRVELLGRVAAELDALELQKYDIDADRVTFEGRVYTRCTKDVAKAYIGSAGAVEVTRNLYRESAEHKAICPLEMRAGIIDGKATPMLARQVCFLMAHMTSNEAEQAFRELGIDGPSSSTCDRLPKDISKTWEERRKDYEVQLRVVETIPSEAVTMAVSLDGVMVPDKEAQKKAKAVREAESKKTRPKLESGPAGYKEVGCGTVSLYAPADETPQASDEDDDRGPRRLSTIRYARAPEYKKKSLTEQLDAEVRSILGPCPDIQLVALADGAEENWRYFSGPVWDGAVKIVDNGHAAEHLRDAFKIWYGAKSSRGRAEYKKFKLILTEAEGGVDQVITELKRLKKKLGGKRNKTRRKEFSKELTYFENQRERMDYAEYRRLGLPIGSGVVEAACKTLATQRMKRSGMSWGGGKQAILTLRSLLQSDRWERGWMIIADSYVHAVEPLEAHPHLSLVA